MMSICNLKSAKQAASYYEKDNYYVAKECPSQWCGKAAEKLGLSGPVGKERFKDLLDGMLPDGTNMPDYDGGRRPGIDLTFSAPKSVSLMYSLTGDRQFLEAHLKAVSKTLSWLERTSSQARITEKGKTRKMVTGNLLAARFDHDLSRELEPNLHSHVVVLNATKREDGVWRAISNEKLYENKMTAGAVYRAELATGLMDLGCEVQVTHPDGRFEMKGFSRGQIEHFSTRRLQIEESMEKRGFSSQLAAEVACLDTRQPKKDVDRAELKKIWKERAVEVGLDLQVLTALRKPVSNREKEKMEAARQVGTLAVDHFSERSSVFSKEELVRFGMQRGTGQTDLSSYEKALSEMHENGELIEVGNGTFTTEKALHLERNIIGMAKNGRGIFRPVMEREKVGERLAGRKLTEEQKVAVETVLGSRDRVVGVQGYAGTGKTSMLRTVKELAEASWFKVRGFSNTATASNLLQEETGIRSDTLARHLLDGGRSQEKVRARGRCLWIVDEASMMGTAQAQKLLRLAESWDAQVVLVGDRKQLPSIEAGKPFSMLMDRKCMDVAVMKDILRQKDPALKKAVVEAVMQKAEASVKALEGRIEQIEDRDERLKAVARDYLSGGACYEDRPLLVTGTNKDRAELNAMIREGMRELGELSGDTAKADILVAGDRTRAELKMTRTYQDGDIVRFGRGYKSLGVSKGEYAQVDSVDLDRGSVRLRLESGRAFDWQPWRHTKVELYRRDARDMQAGDVIRWTRNDKDRGRRNRELVKVVSVDPEGKTAVVETTKGLQEMDLRHEMHWEHGYASTVHAAQGRTYEKVIIHTCTSQKNVVGHESWYVSISRTVHSLKAFTDSLQKLPEAIARSMVQESALEALEEHLEKTRGDAEPDLEKAPEMPAAEQQVTTDRQMEREIGFELER